MIPLRDETPTRRLPIVCITLIALNTLVFLLDNVHLVRVVDYVPTSEGMRPVAHYIGALSLRFAMIPALVTGSRIDPSQLTYQPYWATVFTSMFLHANWLHLGGNMLYLWIFGNNIEDVLGRGKFVLFYLACGVVAAAAQIATDPGSPIPTVGASGAIAGVMGAYILLYPGSQVQCIVPFIIPFFIRLPAFVIIGYWFAIQVLNARMLGGGGMLHQGGVAYMAHVGGFLGGVLLILLMGGRSLAQAPEPREIERDFDDYRLRRD